MTYLDHNATTPPHEDVLAAMSRAARETWANPSSLHRLGRDARRIVEDARDQVGLLAGESARDVLLTSGGTEANNLALVRPFPRGGGGLLVTSRLEHPSVLRVAESLEDSGVRVHWLPIPPTGRYRLEDMERALANRRGSEPVLVAIHAVHHETGVVQPVADVIRLVESAGAELHVDAVQAAGRIPPSLWQGAHTTSIAAHKMRGPKGIGALVTRAGVSLRPILLGGSQERGLRPGTLNPVAAAGFGAAAQRARQGGPDRYACLAPLRDDIERRVLAMRPSASVAGDEPRAPHVTLLLLEGWRGDELVAALDLEGICVASGSACAAGTAEPSAAIAAMVGTARATSALRVSLGETSGPADADAFVLAIERVMARVQKASPFP